MHIWCAPERIKDWYNMEIVQQGLTERYQHNILNKQDWNGIKKQQGKSVGHITEVRIEKIMQRQHATTNR
jgi:hypothetical protein